MYRFNSGWFGVYISFDMYFPSLVTYTMHIYKLLMGIFTRIA